jgi:hypothetical protein
LKIAFKIPPTTNSFLDSNLLLELNNNEMSFIIYSTKTIEVQGFFKYEFEKNIIDDHYANELKNIIANQSLLKENFNTVKIYYNFSKSTLVPTHFFVQSENANVLSLMFGEDKGNYSFDDKASQNEIKVVYRVPIVIHDLCKSTFSNALFYHSTSLQIQKNKFTEDTVECMVYTNYVKVILYKNSDVAIVQYFEYAIAGDVVYHLLNICERFNISASNVHLIISGLVDEQSALYVEMYKYFLNVSFAQLPIHVAVAENLTELPLHFYTNLTALALCE